MENDTENFNQLMMELKQALGEKYLLTLATAGGKGIIDDCEYWVAKTVILTINRHRFG